MMLPFWEGLVKTSHYDMEMARLADRHYSRRTIGATQFAYSGRKLVLRNTEGTVLFVWMNPDQEKRLDNQTGYNCSIFRNESTRRSSDIVIEAVEHAFKRWGPNRVYTYVDGRKIKSTNPGFCFQCAGWLKCGKSRSGLTLLAKEL